MFGENILVCWDTTWHNDLLLPILRNGVCDWLVMPVEVFRGSSCHHTEDVERKAIPPFSFIYPLFRYEERICTVVLWTIMWGTVLLVFSKHANWSLEIFLSFLSVFSANWCTVQLAKLNIGLVAGTEMHVPRIYTTHTGYTLIMISSIGNTYSVCVRLTFAIFLCQTIHWYACVCFITRIGIKKGQMTVDVFYKCLFPEHLRFIIYVYVYWFVCLICCQVSFSKSKFTVMDVGLIQSRCSQLVSKVSVVSLKVS